MAAYPHLAVLFSGFHPAGGTTDGSVGPSGGAQPGVLRAATGDGGPPDFHVGVTWVRLSEGGPAVLDIQGRCRATFKNLNGVCK